MKTKVHATNDMYVPYYTAAHPNELQLYAFLFDPSSHNVMLLGCTKKWDRAAMKKWDRAAIALSWSSPAQQKFQIYGSCKFKLL
jgi:hypothetical protein